MPLEGHWTRQNTPLRKLTPRERKVAIGVLAVTLVAVVAVIVAAGPGTSKPGPAEGCIRVVVAGRTGGETVVGCGAKAKGYCAHAALYADPRAEKILAACRDAAIPTTGKPLQIGPVAGAEY
jgi:hypothetical protein